jgi:hypothetical protein
MLQGRFISGQNFNRMTDRYFLSESRISVNNTSSAEGFGGSAGASSSFFFMLFIALMTMNMAKAMIKKSTTV